MTAQTKPAVVSVRDLTLEFVNPGGPLTALSGLDLDLPDGVATGIVGESGSGKTLTGLAIVGLLPPRARIRSGRIMYGAVDLASLPQREWQAIRGRAVTMIFQDARTSLNPLFTVGQQISRLYQLHGGLTGRQAWDRAITALDGVGIDDAARRARQYPHEFSGGMCQRVAIAMALACSPRLLIADEPTTGLDVTVGAQVLDLLNDLVERERMAMMMISHDFGVIARTCRYVAVMYGGRVMEYGMLRQVFDSPAHPYTQGLLSCLQLRDNKRMNFIPGAAPELDRLPPGCPFEPRCPQSLPQCGQEAPAARDVGRGRWVRCHAVEDVMNE